MAASRCDPGVLAYVNEMDSAIFRVQNHGLPEGELHPEFNPQDHWRLLAKLRSAPGLCQNNWLDRDLLRRIFAG
jgi:hypothetical protein